ncbi:MAG: ABC transporter substrate-binding protein [Chthoniobacteraceae bacterium]
MKRILAILTALIAFVFASCDQRPDSQSAQPQQGKAIIRIGHFPNITHAQALVAAQLKRQGKGWFEERIPGVETQWFVYNAGPSAMEAIFANSIDVTYVGPNPVLNAYSKSKGDEVRVLAGSALGGAALVVQGDGRIAKPADFKGRKLATPQLGNTQDVAARAWLTKQGFKITQLGGDVLVVPTANPDQLSLFQQNQIDAVWTVEPWVTRLEREAEGKVYLEQPDALTTVLASSVKFLREKPELAKKLLAAHLDLTKWINEHPAEARELVRAEIKAQTKRDFPAEVAEKAWSRLKFTGDVSRAQFDALVVEAQSVGFLRGTPPLDRLIEQPK